LRNKGDRKSDMKVLNIKKSKRNKDGYIIEIECPSLDEAMELRGNIFEISMENGHTTFEVIKDMSKDKLDCIQAYRDEQGLEKHVIENMK
jgi:hypothetical protein